MTTAVIFLALGALFVGLGLLGWKRRKDERISLIEAAILKATHAEPLPLNEWDRAMGYAQPVLMLIFGPIMLILGVAMILGD